MDAYTRPALFLTVEELVALTGRKSCRHQLQWLETKGWKHEVNAAGKPIVSRAYAESRLGGGQDNSARRFRPNLAAIESV